MSQYDLNNTSGRGKADSSGKADSNSALQGASEDRIREIFREEMEKGYRSGAPRVPPLQHNGVDNLPINLQNIVGANQVPYTSDKISSPFFYENYSYASPVTLGASQFIVNNYLNKTPSEVTPQTLFASKNLLATIPIPIIISFNNAESFQQGIAPIGTIVGFVTADGTTCQLWMMLPLGWAYVNLTLA